MMSLRPDYWRDKRVLVTGHTGFKGAWLTLILKRLGAHVQGLSLPPETPSLYTQARLCELLGDEAFVDLCDGEATAVVLEKFQPQIVIHLAAQALVREASREPVRTFETNVMGTVNLLNGLLECNNVKVLLCATTDKVYLNLEKKAFCEEDALGGIEPYSSSKVAQESVISAYRGFFEKKRVAVPVCRAGNVIGGGDWAKERLIPDAIRAAMAGQTMEVRNSMAVRPWEHVLDALAGYLMLAEKEFSESSLQPNPAWHAWNFGPDLEQEHVTVGEICEMVSEFWPDKFVWKDQTDFEQISESQFLALNPTKANTQLGWRPYWSSRDSVKRTLEWYTSLLSGEDARALCEAQILKHPAFGQQ